jgi:hypothetical protein
VESTLREAIIKESIETLVGIIEKGLYNPQAPIDLVTIILILERFNCPTFRRPKWKGKISRGFVNVYEGH